jgi:hypothetical protein
MRNYNSEQSADVLAMHHLQDACLLHQRHLPAQAAEALAKAEKLTQQGMDYGLRMATLHLQMHQAMAQPNGVDMQRIHQLKSALKATRQAAKCSERLHYGHAQLRSFYHEHGAAYSTKARATVRSMFAPLEKCVATEAMPMGERYLLFRAHYWHALLLDDDATALRTLSDARKALMPHRQEGHFLEEDMHCVFDAVPLWLRTKQLPTAMQHLESAKIALHQWEGVLPAEALQHLHLQWNMAHLRVLLGAPNTLTHAHTIAQLLSDLHAQPLNAEHRYLLQFYTAVYLMYQRKWEEALLIVQAAKATRLPLALSGHLPIELALMLLVVHAKLGHYDAVEECCDRLKRNASRASASHRRQATCLARAHTSYPHGQAALQHTWRSNLSTILHNLQNGPGHVFVEFYWFYV